MLTTTDTTMNQLAINRSIQFFWDNAGFCYNPKTETKDEGRYRSAMQLVQAELEGTHQGFSFVWDVDDIDSSDFSDDTPHELFYCTCLDYRGDVLSSLGGVDFGPNTQPWSHDYRRVVEAELALEALTQ
jgi:hypothetical protein